MFYEFKFLDNHKGKLIGAAFSFMLTPDRKELAVEAEMDAEKLLQVIDDIRLNHKNWIVSYKKSEVTRVELKQVIGRDKYLGHVLALTLRFRFC